MTIASCVSHSTTIKEEKNVFHFFSLQLPSDLYRPDMFCVKDSMIILYDHYKGGEFLFHSINLCTNVSYSHFGTIGSGPNDYNSPVQIYIDGNTLNIFDRNYFKIYKYEINSILKNETKYVTYDFIAPEADRVIKKNDSVFYCTGLFDGMFGKSEYGKITYTYFEFPEVKGHSLTQLQKFFLYQGDIRTNPSKNKFIYTSNRSDLFKIVSMEQDSLQDIKTQFTYFPKFKVNSTDGMIAILPENLNGFISSATTDKFIFILYSGRSEKKRPNDFYFGNTIFVYDWSGNLINKVTLDRDAWQLYIEENSNILYTINYEMKEIDYETYCLGYNVDDFI